LDPLEETLIDPKPNTQKSVVKEESEVITDAVKSPVAVFQKRKLSDRASTVQRSGDSITLTSDTSACSSHVRFGSAGDGGWNLCDTFASCTAADPGKCVVYSYGIRDDFSFDAACEQRFCEVHGFDPSVHLEAQYAGIRRSFHLQGLGPSGTYAPGTAPFRWPGMDYLRSSNTETWKLMSVTDTMASLKHSNVKILKIDAEGAEWSALDDLLSTGFFESGKVEQFMMELHFDPAKYTLTSSGPNSVTIRRNAADTMDYLDILERLAACGMQMWRWQWNVGSTCCIEVSYMYRA